MVASCHSDSPDNPLHLRDLAVFGFRGIDALSIGRLGRVTLLAGRNRVGKTTALEAVRVFAARHRYSLLRRLLEDREELVAAEEDSEKAHMPDFTALFHGRESRGGRIVVGPTNADEQVTIEELELTQDLGSWVERLFPEEAVDGSVHGLQAVFRGAKQVLPLVSAVPEPGARRIFSGDPARPRWSCVASLLIATDLQKSHASP